MAAKNLSDRRMARRFSLNVPLYISEWKGPTFEEKVELVNISESGVYFETNAPPRQGTMLRLKLEVPPEITGGATVKWCCAGKVVRVGPTGDVSPSLGVGVRFEYYEIS